MSGEELRNVSDRYGKYRRRRLLGPLYDRTELSQTALQFLATSGMWYISFARTLTVLMMLF